MLIERNNYLYYLSVLLGEKLEKEIASLSKRYKDYCNLRSSYFKNNFVTNPVLRTMYLLENNIASKSDLDRDLVFVKFCGLLVNRLSSEIDKNPVFKQELISRLLRYQAGPFLACFSELLVAGYLKFLGYDVTLNSSQEENKPDVFVTHPFQFGNDSKFIPDYEFYFKDKLDKIKDSVTNYLNTDSTKFNLILLVSEINNFEDNFKKTMKEFFSTGKGIPGMGIVVIPSGIYGGYQGHEIKSITTGNSIRFIPSFGLDEKGFEKISTKAKGQFTKANTKGILWVGFINEYEDSIKREIFGSMSKVPKSFSKEELGLVLFDFTPLVINGDEVGYKYALDLFTENDNLSLISKKSFGDYLSQISDSPTIIVSSKRYE